MQKLGLCGPLFTCNHPFIHKCFTMQNQKRIVKNEEKCTKSVQIVYKTGLHSK